MMIKLCRDCKHRIMQPGFYDHLCNQGGDIRSCETERTRRGCGEEGILWEAGRHVDSCAEYGNA